MPVVADVQTSVLKRYLEAEVAAARYLEAVVAVALPALHAVAVPPVLAATPVLESKLSMMTAFFSAALRLSVGLNSL